ncbi:MAG: serine/threonine protein kinase [Bacilli bacterium]
MKKRWKKRFLRYIFVLHNWPFSKGTTVGQYTITSFLGKGGYAIAYTVTCKRTGRVYLMKQLRKEITVLAPTDRFEADVLEGIDVPGVPRLIDTFEEKGKRFLVLDYVDGETVADLLFDARLTLDVGQALALVGRLLAIVEGYHAHGIAHLDLRIPNILLQNGELAIIDWGLAERLPSAGAARDAMIASELHHVGHFTIFLFYSSYEKEGLFVRERPWYDELQLPDTVIDWVMRMLGEKEPFASAQCAREQLMHCILGGEGKNGIV